MYYAPLGQVTECLVPTGTFTGTAAPQYMAMLGSRNGQVAKQAIRGRFDVQQRGSSTPEQQIERMAAAYLQWTVPTKWDGRDNLSVWEVSEDPCLYAAVTNIDPSVREKPWTPPFFQGQNWLPWILGGAALFGIAALFLWPKRKRQAALPAPAILPALPAPVGR